VLYREIRERGYSGGISLLKIFLVPLKRGEAEPVVRFETEPGEQMQADFTYVRRGPYPLQASLFDNPKTVIIDRDFYTQTLQLFTNAHDSRLLGYCMNLSRVKKEAEAVRTVTVILACLALSACATSPSDDDPEQGYQYIPSSTASPLGSKLFDVEAVRGSPMSTAFSNALKHPAYLDDGDKPNIQRLANQGFLSLGAGLDP
jgi:hypothetical protein